MAPPRGPDGTIAAPGCCWRNSPAPAERLPWTIMNELTSESAEKSLGLLINQLLMRKIWSGVESSRFISALG